MLRWDSFSLTCLISPCPPRPSSASPLLGSLPSLPVLPSRLTWRSLPDASRTMCAYLHYWGEHLFPRPCGSILMLWLPSDYNSPSKTFFFQTVILLHSWQGCSTLNSLRLNLNSFQVSGAIYLHLSMTYFYKCILSIILFFWRLYSQIVWLGALNQNCLYPADACHLPTSQTCWENRMRWCTWKMLCQQECAIKIQGIIFTTYAIPCL